MENINFNLNGLDIKVSVSKKETLQSFLREKMGLTGTKRGCDSKECGACTVIIDGKARRSCATRMPNVAGTVVETIEGLSKDGYLHPIQIAFLQSGAVQCGFCTPGVIMSAKALLDINRNPTDDEIRASLKGNICRCTGYESIVMGIKLAGSYLQNDTQYDKYLADGIVGENAVDIEGELKVTGKLLFTDDYKRKDALVGKILWSRLPHAKISDINVDGAKLMPGVKDVITWKDIPGVNGIGFFKLDQPVLAHDRVRSVGDAIALVIAENAELADAACDKINVTYELLPVVSSPETATSLSSPSIQDGGNILKEFSYTTGDVEAAIGNSEVVVRGEFKTPFVEHAYLEPESVLAEIDGEGVLRIITATQYPYHVRKTIIDILDLSEEKVRVIAAPVGGAFGGKIDVHPCIPLAALGALKLRSPVRIKLERKESIISSTKRHPFLMDFKVGLNKEGVILGIDSNLLIDAGPYTGQSVFVAEQASLFACGPYRVPNLRVRAKAVHTNNANGGAFRGYGINQVTFALESLLDEASRKIGLDPIELRMRNILEEGDMTPAGEKLRGPVPGKETIKEAREALLSGAIPKNYREEGWNTGVGVACAMKNVGGGRGNRDKASALLRIKEDGKLFVMTSAPDMGQGIRTGLFQIIKNELGVHRSGVEFDLLDTSALPESSGCSAQRMMLCTGNALLLAINKLKEKILSMIENKLSLAAKDLSEIRDGKLFYSGPKSQKQIVSLKDIAKILKDENQTLEAQEVYVGPNTHSLEDREKVHENHYKLYPTYSYTTVVAVVAVEEKTGRVKVIQIDVFQDVGKAINPKTVKMQLEGSCLQGLGYALKEQYVLKDGVPETLSFGKLGVPKIMDAPRYNTMLIEYPEHFGPYGAKGISETAILAVCPAITNGIADAVGIRVSCLPYKRLVELNV